MIDGTVDNRFALRRHFHYSAAVKSHPMDVIHLSRLVFIGDIEEW